MLVSKQSQLPDGSYEIMYDFDAGEVRFETGIKGIKYDFNSGARVFIANELLAGHTYEVKCFDSDTGAGVKPVVAKKDEKGILAVSERCYHIHFDISVTKDGKEIFHHKFDPKGKNVHIEMMNTNGMGDAICFMTHIEEFRKQHQCNVYITMMKRFVEIFEPVFKDIHFIAGEKIDNEGKFPINVWEKLPKDIYVTYYYEVGYPKNMSTQKEDLRLTGMIKNSADILGVMPLQEFTPKLVARGRKSVIKDPYVCISLHGSEPCKSWHNPFGWGKVVKFLKDKGYRVICIDGDGIKNDDHYDDLMKNGCEDMTGFLPLQDRINTICGAKFFVGMASGLSWLAWACGKPVVMISGFSLPHSEFYTPYRVINTEVCHGCWNDMKYPKQPYLYTSCPIYQNTPRQWECSKQITAEMVLDKVKKLLKDIKDK
ncbi:MAG: autotransporter strand-loop-strand O-heptosyltransferase [Phascolarctobacterium sp.]|nr:autotransporter strand-loop-strand O-heptosyltransferase [Candidatus Phascolarctobacterium caballi]